jgi:TolA-binding protein
VDRLDPENVRLRVARARARSRFVLREEGREDYETAIRSLLRRDPTEAARVFTEFFGRYGRPLSPKEQLALTPALVRIGAVDAAARALELAAEAPGIEAADRERALLRQAQLLASMSLQEAATHVYEKLVREYPGGSASSEAKLQLSRAGAAVRPA